jgi:hypothetical protein
MAPRKTTKQSNRKQGIEIQSAAISPARNGNATVASPESKNGSSNGARPSYEQVQVRAYEIFVARGAAHGRDWDDWFRAEQELSASAATH